MHKYIFCLIAFTSIILSFFAQDNHMDIMTTMTGEYNFSYMGWIMTTLDWNGDGYDDLVIDENAWKPPEYQNDSSIKAYGKMMFYYGGPSFDNSPEFTMPGHHEWEYAKTSSICNAGDMNHDGYDDLALFRATMYEGNSDQQYDLQLCVYYGSAYPDTIPDYVLTFPREEFDNGYAFVKSLGDINDDLKDDLGYFITRVGYPYQMKFGVIYGGSLENTDLREIDNIQRNGNITGVGDVNADGIDDFCIGYGYGSNSNPFYRITLYFGNTSGVFVDSLILSDGLNSRNPFSYPAGDLNWDGNSDFVSVFSGSSARLYFGGQDFNGTNYINISPPYCGNSGGEGFGYGDVNGNGTDDLMGTFVSQADGYGDAYLWMGGVPMNGTPDLHIIPHDLPWPAMIDYEMFGFCLTMGDYNGDGYCDAAISAPFDYASFPEPGHVFIFAGNPQLDDPTPIEDTVQIPVISKIQLYPNPLQPLQSNLNVKFIQESINANSTFEIYNIKGQKVKSFTMSAEQTKSGSANYNLNDLSSGVYICIYANGEQLQKGKITIMK